MISTKILPMQMDSGVLAKPAQDDIMPQKATYPRAKLHLKFAIGAAKTNPPVNSIPTAVAKTAFVLDVKSAITMTMLDLAVRLDTD